MTVHDLLAMLGGLAVFMFGMHTLSAALEKFAGGKLENWLEKMTSNPIKGVALGAGVTALIQSSAATTVMMVGFVNSGIMKLSQAIGVIMGANIGTTATGWILSLSGLKGSGLLMLVSPDFFTPVLAIIGVVLVMFTKADRKKTFGTILLGFSLLMFGMNMMSGAAEGLKDNAAFRDFMVMFTNPFLGVLVGALLTAVLQSSSVSIGILQTLARETGTITYGIALPIILGQNIGSCVTALISAIGANKSAKRVAIVHLYFNVIGTIVFLSLFYLINALIDLPFMEQQLEATGIAVIHTCFNVVVTLLFLPFTKQLEKLACLTIRDKAGDEEREVPLLDKRLLNTPSVAIEQCKNVAFRMAKLTKKTLLMSLDLVTKYDKETAQAVIDNEDTIDVFEDNIGSYILKISSKDLSVNDSQIVSNLLHTIGDLERISDHAVNIMEAAEEMHTKKVRFSAAAEEEVNIMIRAVTEILEMSINSFISFDVALAKEVEPLEDVIDGLRTELKNRHVKRLRDGVCTIELGFILQDLLTNFERVSDHCSNIAVCLIQIKENSMDTHEYMNELKRLEKSEFMDEFNQYKAKYALPE
ncbi:MAG: Na/Pi cotransporter family protein [Lachnospiraceae bacterium]|nr:Na/Pi cotransporter family protein [Ruminococcus sp.]MCM1275254.1 Na/Pi cotransporter family protein [Lachnospiraceae bacterium]